MTTNAIPAMWQHQMDAVAHIENMVPDHGALLYYGMGTGKTRTVVEFMRRHPELGPTLIVCPKAVMATWADEFNTYAPGQFRVVILDKGTSAKKAETLADAVATPGRVVVVVNYETAWRKPVMAAAIRAEFDVMVLDEIHRIKAPGGKASRGMARLAKMIPVRIGLSGTPTPHSPLDAYGVFRALDVSVFGTSFVRFRSRYAIMGGFERREVVGFQNEDEMNAKFHSITIHRDRSVLDLPDAHHVERVFDLPPAAARAYREMENDMVAWLGSGDRVTADNVLVRILRLQQITSGFVTVDDDNPNRARTMELHDSKVEQMEEILTDLPVDESVVVFTRFNHDVAAVRVAANAAGRQVFELTGHANELAEWKSTPGAVLAANIRSGGEGVSMVESANVIFYSQTHSLGAYEQSLARSHRPGQSRPVTYFHLVARNTIDAAIRSALDSKKSIIDRIIRDRRVAS